MAFAITEPDAGSNSHRITTTARRDGSDWILKGQKVFISGVDQAQAVLVVGRAFKEEGQVRITRPALFIVPTDTPGFTWTKIDMELVSPESQFQLFLDDVRLPSDALVGSEDAAIAQLFAGLNPERIMGAASRRHGSVGDRQGRRVRQDPSGVEDADRRAPGPVAHPLAQNHIEVELAKLMMQKAATLRQRRRLRRRRGGEHGQVRRGRGVRACSRPGGSVAGRQRVDQEYGIAAAVTASKLARIAPVSRDGAQSSSRRPRWVCHALTDETLVHYTVEGPVARLTLDSPHNRNALSTALVDQLSQGLCDASDDASVRAVVLGHTGGTFCAAPTCRRPVAAMRPRPSSTARAN